MLLDVSLDNRELLGHRLEERWSPVEGRELQGFLKTCTFKGQNCRSSRWRRRGAQTLTISLLSLWRSFFSPNFGNCFTFNSGLDNRTVGRVTLTGPSNGLMLELFLDQGNYLYNRLSRKAGARLTIHDPLQQPLPAEDGLDLQPGTASSVAVQGGKSRTH